MAFAGDLCEGKASRFDARAYAIKVRGWLIFERRPSMPSVGITAATITGRRVRIPTGARLALAALPTLRHARGR